MNNLKSCSLFKILNERERERERKLLTKSCSPLIESGTGRPLRAVRRKLGSLGFTLIELLVVVGVIAILAGTAIVGLRGAREGAITARTMNFANSVRTQLILGEVGNWGFDGNLQDTSGLHNHGTFHGGTPTYVDGVVRRALSFDGVDDFVQTTHSTGLNGNLPHTVIMWVKLNTITPVSSHQEFFNFDTWEIGMWWHGSFVGHINRFRVHQTNGATGFYSTIDLPAHTDWIMLGQVFNGTTIRHIINDRVVTGTVNPFSSAGVHLPRIGRIFPGLIDEVRIYNEALRAEEVQMRYAQGLKGLLARGMISPEEFDRRMNELQKNLGGFLNF